MANSLVFPFHNCCISGTKPKTRTEYSEVKQEDSMDDVAEEKPDLKSCKGKLKIQSRFSARSAITSCYERGALWNH